MIPHIRLGALVYTPQCGNSSINRLPISSMTFGHISRAATKATKKSRVRFQVTEAPAFKHLLGILHSKTDSGVLEFLQSVAFR